MVLDLKQHKGKSNFLRAGYLFRKSNSHRTGVWKKAEGLQLEQFPVKYPKNKNKVKNLTIQKAIGVVYQLVRGAEISDLSKLQR